MEDVNVSTDIALCRSCGNTCFFSEIASGNPLTAPDLGNPPAGTWFEQLPQGFRLGASTSSWMALFLVPFTCVWSGGSLSGIYGTQIKSGHFNLLPSLFGLPFLIGSVFLISTCIMSVAGKIELTQREDRLAIFMGIGPLGWTRNFLWSDFTSVREDSGRNKSIGNLQGMVIVLEGKRRVAFGSILREEKRYFVISALRKMLRDNNRPLSSAIRAPLFR